MRSDDVEDDEEEAMQRLRIRREEDDKKWKEKILRVEMGGSGVARTGSRQDMRVRWEVR